MATKAPKEAALKASPTKASTSVAVRKEHNVVSIQEQLRKQAEESDERINPATGSKIKCGKDKMFTLPDGTKASSLELVVLDFNTTHDFYETKFDPSNPAPPGCYAIGINPKKMFPAANAPNKVHSDCQTCPNNEWESAGGGSKAKACKNGRMLAVLPPDASDTTPVWLLHVSSTAIKGWDGYVASLKREFQLPPISFITTVTMNEDSEYQMLEFSNPVPNPGINDHFGRQAEATELLSQLRDVSGYKPVAAPKRAAGRR